MSKKATADQPPKDIAMPPLPLEVAQALEPEEVHVAEAAPEAANEEIVQKSTSDVESSRIEAKPAANAEVESAKEKNFKALREQRDQANRERDEYARRMQDLEKRYATPHQNSQANTNNQNETEPEDLALNFKSDDLLEGKHLEPLVKEIRQLRKEVTHYKQQSSAMTVESRIRSEMPDFEKVVSEENVALLRTMEPELAEGLAATPDFYIKAKAAYKTIKRLGIHTEDTFVADKAIAQKNAAKPRPLASVSPQQGDSPLSRANAFANGLTPELQEQLRKEMLEARRAY